ncbi:hypothetical protein [Devosia chinhatensis]|uniref:Uncharacterized protein n=1 Tax=Devosia chinhatensis TaxID=429727 RepID=A0A0F5FLF1_9HYPH|nr:hypothetical protein [Devosia chinhatensis]KKB09400.1 hypothetical protein VE26_05535 [Devosia chinhatensis]
MDKHHDDPALAEAIARRDESRAQILRSKANAAGGSSTDRLANAFEKLADQAEKASRQSATALDLIEPAPLDPEGTERQLADSEGNFASNAEVAATGGIGIKASNTAVTSGQPAQTAEQAGEAVTSDAQKIIGDQPVGGAATSRTAETDETRAAVVIPEGWKDLSWQERRSIASKVSDTPIANGEEANTAIEAELKRRG